MTDIATLALRADSSDLRQAQSELRSLTSTGGQTERQVTGATRSMERGFRSLARAAMLLAGPVIAGLSFRSLTREAAEFETQMARVEAVISATGGAAGRSAEDVEAFAQSLARGTLESVEGVVQAQQVLLTFGNVAGETFERTISAAADMAATFGGDVVSSTRQLARAMEDPVNGLELLGRQFPAFRGELRDTIEAMAEAGDIAGAQEAILAELEGRIGGVARASSPLSAAQDSLSQSFRNLRLAIAESTGAANAWASVIGGVDGIVQAAADNVHVLGDALAVAGAAMVGLAATQLPAVTAAIYAKVAAIWAATTAVGVYTAALRGLSVMVGALGGPVGILLGLLAGGAAAALLLRDNISETEAALEETRKAQEALNAAMGVFYQTAAPQSAREALGAAQAYRIKAAAAREDAAAEVARRQAQIAALGQGVQTARTAGMRSRAQDQLDQAISDLQRAETALEAAEAAARRTAGAITGDMSARVEEVAGQLSVLSIDVDGVSDAFDGLGASAGAAGAAVGNAADEVITRLRDEIDLIGQGEEARRLYQELQAAGVSLYTAEGQAIADLVEELYRLEEAQFRVEEAARRVESSFESAFVSFVTGAQSARNVAASLLQDLARLAAQSAFRALMGGFGGAPLNAMGSGPLAGFEGGGFTGYGPRTGGLDGRGGFPAILHPNETVIDHTKPQSAPARTDRVVVELRSDMLQAMISEGSAEVVQSEAPGAVNRSMSRGGFDRTLSGRFGDRPKRIRR